MRVTFVLPFAGLQGGIRVVAIHAERLLRRGHQVTVISTPPSVRRRTRIKSWLLGHGAWDSEPEPSYFDGLSLEHRVLDRVRPVTDADVPDADVVVATYYTTAPGVLALSPSKGAKAIFLQGYEIEQGKSNPALDETWRMPMHKIIISRWLVALARERFGDGMVSHVPNSVDLLQFNAPPRPKAAVPTVGLLYAKAPIKGCATSLKALKIAHKALPQLRVVAFGAEQPDWTLPLPSFASFHFRPPQDQIRQLYASCQAWLCGSYREGFHLPPLEAMACRCPVVSTRVGGPLDTVEDGVNGYLVDVNDADALARRLVQVLQLPEPAWRQMSDAAFRTATRFSWDDASQLFEQALDLAITRRRLGQTRQ